MTNYMKTIIIVIVLIVAVAIVIVAILALLFRRECNLDYAKTLEMSIVNNYDLADEFAIANFLEYARLVGKAHIRFGLAEIAYESHRKAIIKGNVKMEEESERFKRDWINNPI